ncbi:hypothetical protein CYMTET_46965 [Cymbomonas tetramitiformis]|uniref:Steroid 5-alpha reductase C-terminal domain-containing protein n=1 Tax=Cymbomonas tetramitiformis TaxID=36881 RepID=A0AAE0BWA9_9CHLO|nr:hypothetical protein CYMTET_46965 [Cymbomonas tetramitiformis]
MPSDSRIAETLIWKPVAWCKMQHFGIQTANALGLQGSRYFPNQFARQLRAQRQFGNTVSVERLRTRGFRSPIHRGSRASRGRAAIQHITRASMIGLFAESPLLGTLAVDMGIQWVAFAIAAFLQTEKFYDLTGSLTFISLAIGTLFAVGSLAPRQILVTGMVVLWALRLGTFLVIRIAKDGKDSRFDEAKKNPPKFFVFWTLQGIWVWVTALPLWLLNSSPGSPAAFSVLDGVGLLLWVVGFAIEAAADFQKFRFKLKDENKGRFIQSGLWKYSRHPNYFGEIMMWWGVYAASVTSLSFPAAAGAMASPLFVMGLLLYVSGVPMLEASADERWGDDPEYQEYKRQSRVILPLPK